MAEDGVVDESSASPDSDDAVVSNSCPTLCSDPWLCSVDSASPDDDVTDSDDWVVVVTAGSLDPDSD